MHKNGRGMRGVDTQSAPARYLLFNYVVLQWKWHYGVVKTARHYVRSGRSFGHVYFLVPKRPTLMVRIRREDRSACAMIASAFDDTGNDQSCILTNAIPERVGDRILTIFVAHMNITIG
jgi:hypothetical protein